MMRTILEMAKELVTAQIQTHQIPPDEVQSLLQSTHATLHNLYQIEISGHDTISMQPPAESPTIPWKRSITRHAVICIECGETFKQLSARHLRTHDLDPRAYRAKHGIPRTQALSARKITARRRELAKQIRPWELAHKQRGATKTKGKTSAKG